MYAALGGLIVGLVALMIMPAVWNRAVRLTTRRYRTELPINLDEVKAERDQLRAEHALAARQLELRQEAAEARAGERMREAGQLRAEAEAARLMREAERAEATATRQGLEATIAALEARVAGLGEDIAARDSHLADVMAETAATRERLEADLAAARATLATQAEEIRGYADLAVDLDRRIAEAKMDLAAAQSQGEILRGKVQAMTQERNGETARAGQLESELRGRDAAVAREKQKVDALEARIDRMRADLADRDEAIEKRTRDIARLEAELERERQRTTDLAEALGEAKRREMARGEAGGGEMAAHGRDNVDKALAAAELQRTELERRLVIALGERDQKAERLAAIEATQAEFDQRVARENAALRQALTEVAGRIVGLEPRGGARPDRAEAEAG